MRSGQLLLCQLAKASLVYGLRAQYVERVMEVTVRDRAERGLTGQAKGHLLKGLSREVCWLEYHTILRCVGPRGHGQAGRRCDGGCAAPCASVCGAKGPWGRQRGVLAGAPLHAAVRGAKGQSWVATVLEGALCHPAVCEVHPVQDRQETRRGGAPAAAVGCPASPVPAIWPLCRGGTSHATWNSCRSL